jgi:hypothetical protein
MPTTTAQEVRRVPSSEELLHPGEFVFIQKREPITNYQSVPLTPPTGFFRRILWNLFGKRYELKATVTELWPAIDTILLNCPVCNGPFATTDRHTICNVNPLTIETPITCPYCRTFTFKVAEGKIVLA